ncbi:MAG: CHAD domain-containing protein [Pseudomonadota bacterium]
MPYQIDFQQPLGSERRRIALELIEGAAAALQNESRSIHKRIHDFRVRTKKLRALARLFRSADDDWFRRENRRFRDLAHQYSSVRDAESAIDTFRRLIDQFDAQINHKAFASLFRDLLHHRQRRVELGASDERLVELLSELDAARTRVADWPDNGIDAAIITQGFTRTYQRGRRTMCRLRHNDDNETWHEWRKRVKHHRYHWEVLANAWPAVVQVWCNELHRLTDYLGDDHDLTVLADLIRSDEFSHKPKKAKDRRSVDALLGLIHQRSTELRRDAAELGAKLYVDNASAAQQRLSGWLAISGARTH